MTRDIKLNRILILEGQTDEFHVGALGPFFANDPRPCAQRGITRAIQPFFLLYLRGGSLEGY